MDERAALSARRNALRPLTSLRFFAALLVFVTHSEVTRRYAVVFGFGYAGVGFFFLLSGFILTYTYWHAFDKRLTGDAVRAFYRARIARVYPVYLVTMTMMLIFLSLCGGDFWTGLPAGARLRAVVAELLVVQSWLPAAVNPAAVNPPAWSIAVEALFYALFPVLLWGLLRVLRQAWYGAILAAAAAVWTGLAVWERTQHVALDQWPLYTFPPARLPEFLIGMLLGVAFLRRPAGTTMRSATRAELLALCCALAGIVWSPGFPGALRFGGLLIPAFALIIWVFAQQRGALSRALGGAVFVRLGEISFSLYLVHLFAVYAVQRTGAGGFLALLGSFALTLALSFALYHLVEEPLRALIRRPSSHHAHPVHKSDLGASIIPASPRA